MMIEFIGSTGAGKTTLIAEVKRRLAQIESVTTSFKLVASPLGLRNVTHPTARHLIQEFVGFPFFIRSVYQHRAFIIFTLRMLARQAHFSVFMINNLRSLVRKISVYEMIKQRQHDQIVLVDEGTVLLSHNIFVYSSALYTSEEIARFASLVPLPDIIIYIKAPVDIMVERTLRRADPPREIKSGNRDLIEKQINRAVTMFDQLVEAENIKPHLLIVESPELDEHQYEMLVNEIIEFIMNCKLISKISDR